MLVHGIWLAFHLMCRPIYCRRLARSGWFDIRNGRKEEALHPDAVLNTGRFISKASSSGCGSATTTAQNLADANANDGTSAVDEVCGTAAGLTACANHGPRRLLVHTWSADRTFASTRLRLSGTVPSGSPSGGGRTGFSFGNWRVCPAGRRASTSARAQAARDSRSPKRSAATYSPGCASRTAASRAPTCAMRRGSNGRCWRR